MTDEEFITFVRECTLSNEEIAEEMEVAPFIIQRWRQGVTLPLTGVRSFVVRRLSLLEHTRLSEQIQDYTNKRQR